jgi:uncharacterized protein
MLNKNIKGGRNLYFYERIKIRRLLLVSFLLTLGFGILDAVLWELGSITIDAFLMQLFIDLGLLIWFITKFRDSGNTLSDFTEEVKTHFKWKEIILVIVIHLLITFGFIFLIVLAVSYISPDSINAILNDDSAVIPEVFSSKVYYFITAVFLAPIVEEITFRGIILNRLKVRWGTGSAIIISSVLFGILHFRMAIVGAIVFGVCMSLVYLRTRKILITMTIHFLNNLFASVLMFFPGSDIDGSQLFTLQDARFSGFVLGIPLTILSIILLIYYLKKSWPQKGAQSTESLAAGGKNIALLVADMQEGMFSIPGHPIYNADGLLQNVSDLINKAREAKMDIIYIQHSSISKGILQYGSPGWKIHNSISPGRGEMVIQKHSGDPFNKTKLQQELKFRNIGHIVLVGLQTEYFIDTTCRRASGLGYNVVLVGDGHSTFEAPHLTAEQIIDHHNKILGNSFVNLRSTEEILEKGFYEVIK